MSLLSISRYFFIGLFIVGAAFISGSYAETPEQRREIVFKEADQALHEAQAKQADFYAPKTFAKGMRSYERAAEDFAADKRISGIQSRLKEAVENFQKALEIALVAEGLFADAISGRNDAMSAEAVKYAADIWERGETRFRNARRSLEDGDRNTARNRGKEASDTYREAELRAIKVKLMQGAWDAMENARTMNVRRNAPKTLEKAQVLVDKTEDLLNRDRYNTAEAVKWINSAIYHANYAAYLNQKINSIRTEGKTYEDLFIEAETPLRQISEALEETIPFDQGMSLTFQTIIASIIQLQEEKKLLTDSLKTKNDDIAELVRQRTEKELIIKEREAEISELRLNNSTLLMRVQQLQSYENQLRNQELQRQISSEKFNKIVQSFSANEGSVSQTAGGEILIRLTGLYHEAINRLDGKAVIEPKYFSLLSKVNDAINEFPECRIVIEGHTDSSGKREDNLKLSHSRAVAVMAYIIANAGVKQERITANGYGEQSPIASNETPEGRQKNCRIDIIIQPVSHDHRNPS